MPRERRGWASWAMRRAIRAVADRDYKKDFLPATVRTAIWIIPYGRHWSIVQEGGA